ncbi:MAG: DUF4129 domain-containing protein [Pirellulales bacterium]
MNLPRRQAWIATLAIVATIAAAPSAARAGASKADKSIADGREAFGEASFPWYDGQTDSLKPLKFRAPPDWEPWKLGPVLKVVAWVALAILVAAIVAVVIYVLRQRGARATDEATHQDETVLPGDQVEALPFLAQRRRDDLLGQARFHYQQGNYSEAIIYLFSYKLVQLDKFAVIHLAKGKTNRQYLRETARVTDLKSPLERTMLAFESVFFGSRTLDRAGFEACWNALPQFEQQLRAAT